MGADHVAPKGGRRRGPRPGWRGGPGHVRRDLGCCVRRPVGGRPRAPTPPPRPAPGDGRDGATCAPSNNGRPGGRPGGDPAPGDGRIPAAPDRASRRVCDPKAPCDTPCGRSPAEAIDPRTRCGPAGSPASSPPMQWTALRHVHVPTSGRRVAAGWWRRTSTIPTPKTSDDEPKPPSRLGTPAVGTDPSVRLRGAPGSSAGVGSLDSPHAPTVRTPCHEGLGSRRPCDPPPRWKACCALPIDGGIGADLPAGRGRPRAWNAPPRVRSSETRP
eukprot:scaffold633_cov321-Pavlova_lutheri.AAC.13